MTPQSGDDRRRWATAVASLVRNLIRAGYSGTELAERIRRAKHKPTEEVEQLALAAYAEAESNE
jgi:hypothetical protein